MATITALGYNSGKLEKVSSDDTLVIGGNLQVDGTTTTVNSTTISVDDKNIELGSVDTPSDTTADGGGITLKGASDHTILWTNSTDSWDFSEHVNLASGKQFKINGSQIASTDLSDGAGLQQKPSEGAFANGDKTKLNGIETSADVTDTANVTAAGALMDSEVTNLALVKGLTGGIGNGNVLQCDANVVDDDFLRIAGTAVEGRSASQVLGDIGAQAADADLTALSGCQSGAAAALALLTSTEVAILDGATASTAELNLLAGKSFVDEDNMASNSATAIASQQSIKAYVDSQVAGDSFSSGLNRKAGQAVDTGKVVILHTDGTLMHAANNSLDYIIGIAASDGANDGDVIQLIKEGSILNTGGAFGGSGQAVGDALYLHTDGQEFTNVPPTSGHVIRVGTIVTTGGKMLYKVQHIMSN